MTSPTPEEAEEGRLDQTDDVPDVRRNVLIISAQQADAQRQLVRFLIVMLTVFFLGIAGATIYEYQSYASGLEALRTSCPGRVCFAEQVKLFVVVRPFLSFVVVRNLAVYMSFVLILVGCTFVLAVPDGSPFKVGVSKNHQPSGTLFSGSLKTSSPGLVLIAVGALLVMGTLYRQASPSYAPSPRFLDHVYSGSAHK